MGAAGQEIQCDVCLTRWNGGKNVYGLDIGTCALDYVAPIPCPTCSRHPGLNSPKSCGGCRSDVAVERVTGDGAVRWLCAGCVKARSLYEGLRLEEAAAAAASKADDFGVSLKRHEKCAVCFTVWDRGEDRATACPECSRHPGRNTRVSCAGCANTHVNVWLKLDVLRTGSDAGREVRLCSPCASVRRRYERERAEVAEVTPPKRYALGGFVSTQVEANADAPLNGDAGGRWSPSSAMTITGAGVKMADGGDVPAGLLVTHTCSKCKTTDAVPVGAADPKQMRCPHVFRFDEKLGTRGALACDCGLHVPAETLTEKGRVSFSLKEFAESFFVSDPRVLAIVNRVTGSEPPTSREQRARAKPIRLVYGVLPENAVENMSGCIVLAGSAKVEFIEPRDELRKRRMAAFKVAWGRERALRHEAIRRAIFLWRGAPR